MFALIWNVSSDFQMEETKPLFKEKHDFENRSNSELKIFSAFSDIKILMQESKQKPFVRIIF